MSDQLPLDLGELPAAAGQVERAYAYALTQHAAMLEGADAGLAALALALARAVDGATRNVRGLAPVAKELREVSTRLRLDPTARGGAGDPIADLLAELGKAERRGPVGHPGDT